MDKDRIAGSAKEIRGAVKQVAGKALGDAKLEADGKADRIEARFRTPSAASKTRSKANSRRSRRQITSVGLEALVLGNQDLEHAMSSSAARGDQGRPGRSEHSLVGEDGDDPSAAVVLRPCQDED